MGRLAPQTRDTKADGDWDELLQTTFLSCGLRREVRLSIARAFIVRDVAAPPHMIDLAASLVGGIVASVARMARPPGPILRYGRTLSQKRALWISPGVRRKSPNTIELIRTAVRHAMATAEGTGWKLVNKAEFSLMAARGRPDRRRQQALVALVTATEKARLPACERHYCRRFSELAAGCKQVMC